MKELCSCNDCRKPHAGYVTPWCSLLHEDDSCAVLHLWYKMDILRQEARKRLAYLGISNGYQNVPDVNDLCGVEPSGTAVPLQLSYAESDLREELKKRLAYLGAASGYVNAPDVHDLVGVEPSGTPVPLQLSYTESDLRTELRKRLAYLGAASGYQNAPNVNDLVGVEPTGTPVPLHFTFSPSDIQTQAKAMLAYLGAANGYQNVPNIDDLVSNYSASTGTSLLLSYTLDALKEEIEKKTAFLGKFRRSEDTPHLLDLIAVTNDENELLMSFIKEAMIDVWNILSAPFVSVSKSVWWQDTATTTYPVGAYYQFDMNYSAAYDINPLNQAVLNALVERIIYKWLLYAYPNDAAQYDANFQQATAEMQVYCNDFKAKAANIFTPLVKEAMMDVWNVLSAPFVAVTKKAWWQDTATAAYPIGVHYDFSVEYTLTTSETDALERLLLEAIVARVISKWLVLAYPEEAAKFDTTYQQTIAAIPQRVNDFKARWSGLFVPFAKEAVSEVWNTLSAPFVAVEKKAWWQDAATATYTAGAHYTFEVNYVLAPNETDALQHIVLDALASRIIYKWLLASYPDEAPKFDTSYQQAITAIPQRVNEFKARWSGLLVPFAKEAMTEVWNSLAAPFVGITKKAWWQDTATATYTVGVHYLFNVNYVLTTSETDTLQHIVLDALASRIIYKWLLASYPDEAVKFDNTYKQALEAIPQRVNEFKARWSGLFVPFAKAAMADVYKELGIHMPRHDKAYWFREGQETVIFTDSPLPSPAVTFHAGQYVEYNNDLYIAIQDGSSDDFVGKLVPTEDYRDSVHFGILWCCNHNVNAVEPLDTAIFETLVARIVYKWVMKAYPVEADTYLADYNENLEHVRDFARMLEGPQFVNRIPRMF